MNLEKSRLHLSLRRSLAQARANDLDPDYIRGTAENPGKHDVVSEPVDPDLWRKHTRWPN